MHRTIRVHPAAPAKPAAGEPCNGCGVCCLAVPCPVGMLVSRRSTGACSALRWQPDQGLYRCGLLLSPPARQGWFSRHFGRLLRRLARRYISAGTGCDSTWAVPAGRLPGKAGPAT